MDSTLRRGKCLRLALGRIAEWLYGCAHRRTTFPITLRTKVSMGEKTAPSETYIVCLACGRHLAYDWTEMRIARQLASRVGRLPDLGGISKNNGVTGGETLLSKTVEVGFHREARANRGSR
jgi:hypothetical protein